MIASVVALLLVLLFYIEAMNTEIEAIDNDGDSLDNDGDGYPNGQEKLLGTNPDEAEDYPIGVEPDPPEKWINEDDINWKSLQEGENYVGEDDDGDCLEYYDTASQRDTNDNGNECDIIVNVDSFNSTISVISTLAWTRIRMKINTARKQVTEPLFSELENSESFIFSVYSYHFSLRPV